MRKIFLQITIMLAMTVSSYAQKWEEPDWREFQFPKVEFDNMAEETMGWSIYNRIVPQPEEFIQQHALWVARTLYGEYSNVIPRVEKIKYTFEDKEGISAKGGHPPVVHIFYSSQWVEYSAKTAGDDKVLYETRGVLYHELTHAYQLEPQGIGSYGTNKEFWAFIEGMADAVRYHSGFFPVANRRPGGHWLDGYQTTGFFLQWLTCKDPDFIRKFNASTQTVIPWSFDGAMAEVLGEGVTTEIMWKEYQEFLRK